MYLNYLENLSVGELISKAIEFEQAGKYRNAISLYDLALVESFDSNEIEIKALVGKGSALNAIGQYENALVYFFNALEIEPNNINVLKKISFTYAQLGQLDEAEVYFEISNQLN